MSCGDNTFGACPAEPYFGGRCRGHQTREQLFGELDRLREQVVMEHDFGDVLEASLADLMLLERTLGWLLRLYHQNAIRRRSHPEGDLRADGHLGDWACVECHPNSDILKADFLCAYHAAKVLIPDIPVPGEPEPERGHAHFLAMRRRLVEAGLVDA